MEKAWVIYFTFNADSQTADPQLCDAKRENNPLCGSFPARFTVISNRVLNNRKRLPNMDKFSQKILPLLCEHSERSGKVCKGFASHSSSASCHTAQATAVGRAHPVTPTAFQSTEPGSPLLNRKAGICMRKACVMSNAHIDLSSLHSVLKCTQFRPPWFHVPVPRGLSHPQITALTAEVEAIFSHIFQSQQLTAPHPKPKPPHIPFYNDITGCSLQQL